jgi:hypothetical protein
MTGTLTDFQHLFSRLEGAWTGEGRGEFPGVTSFAYRETLVFTRHDDRSLAYEQRAQKRYDGQTEWLVSHWESGFVRILENSELEMISAQIGRSEVLVGSIETVGDVTQIHFVSKTITNDPRMVSSMRMLALEGDTLRYEMGMHTTKVERLTPHLKIALQRVK